MESKIIQETQNQLFNRKEIILEIQADSAPSNIEVEKIISKKFSIQPDVFKIKKIIGRFGSRDFKIIANIYSSKKEKENVEFKSKKEKEAEKKAIEEGTTTEEVKKTKPAEKSKEEKEKIE